MSNLVGGAVSGFGGLRFSGRAFLAPLSGVTDVGMRRAAQQFGASLVVSEMVSADAYVAADEEARLRAEGLGLAPHVVQIAGRDPHIMAEAARLAEAAGADAVDINMGCPAKRVVGGYAGSALMREPCLATEIVREVVGAVRVPVSVKMRLGWDDASRNAPELGRHFEREGVAWITVHARTRMQFYRGSADWRAIAAVRDAVTIPVVANGDCRSLADARAMLAASGADAVMVGRAAIGRPWLVGAIAAGLRNAAYREPSDAERREAAIGHYESLVSMMGSLVGTRHSRKHLAAYVAAAVEDGWTVEPDVRSRLVTSEAPAEIVDLLSGLWQQRAPMRAAA